MTIENIEEIVDKLQSSLDGFTESVNGVLEQTFDIDETAPLSEQIRVVDEVVMNVESVMGSLSNNFNEIINTLNEVSIPLREELRALRQRHLEEETDTPREAADNIKLAMERMHMSDEDRGLIESALKFLKTLVPPMVEEIEEIPFETARVDDNKLALGTEVVEREGVKGEVKVVYEIQGEERIEVSRVVISEPVMALVRVGTKVDGIQ